MHFPRAEEILKSPENITVLYQKEKIWLHNLNPADKTAEISYLNSPEEMLRVAVSQLQESADRGLQ